MRRLKGVGYFPESEYDRLKVLQKNCCGICGVDFDQAKGGKRRVNVDHDHRTGIVRGLLCISCNVLLGRMETDHFDSWLERKKEYIENSKQNVVRVSGLSKEDVRRIKSESARKNWRKSLGKVHERKRNVACRRATTI